MGWTKEKGTEGFCDVCQKNVWKIGMIEKAIDRARQESPDGMTAWDRVESFRLKHGHLPGDIDEDAKTCELCQKGIRL